MTELQITYFLKVVEHMSYSKAAKELFVTQPSVSCQISALEDELQFQLFDRTRKNRIILTPAGRIFLDGMTKTRQLITHTLQAASLAAKSDAFRARIGLCEGWHLYDLVKNTKDTCYRQFPHAEIYFESNSFKELKRKLYEDELDVILCVQTCINAFEGFKILHVADTNTVFFYGKGHSLKNPDKPELSDFTNDPYYVLPIDETPLSRDINHGYFISQLLNPTIIELPTRDSILLEIGGGTGYTVFDSWTSFAEYPEISTFTLDSILPICIVQKENKNNPLVDIFLDQVKQLPRSITLF